MKMLSEITKDALELPAGQRLTLARILLDISEPDQDLSSEVEAAWDEETDHWCSNAIKPACSKCSSVVSACLSPRSCIITNEIQSTQLHSLSVRSRNSLQPSSQRLSPRGTISTESDL